MSTVATAGAAIGPELAAKIERRSEERVPLWREAIPIVDGVCDRNSILLARHVIGPHSPEVLADMLQGIGERFGDPAGGAVGIEKLGTIGDGPECQQRLDTRDSGGARSGVGNKGEVAQAQLLAKTFIVAEEK